MQNRSGPNRRTMLAGASALAAVAATAPAAAAQENIDLSGKSVLITGSSSGFGRLASLHLARLGATVVASMRNVEGGARAEAKDLTKIARDEELALTVVDLDVTQPGSVANGIAAAEEIAGGALDVVLNNAGIGLAGPVELHDEEAMALQFQTNLFGYQRVARAALPAMRARGEGLLIQVSSQLGRLILPNIGMYCATKFAIEAMFEAMAYELAPTASKSRSCSPADTRPKSGRTASVM